MQFVKQYIGILTQSGPTPPQEVSSRTDFNKPITWTRQAPGVYMGTCVGGWTKERTQVQCHGSTNGTILLASAIITEDDEVRLYFDNEDGANLINLTISFIL